MTVLHQCYAFCDLWLSQNLPLNADFLLPGGIYYHLYEESLAAQRQDVDDDGEEDVDIKWLLDNMDEENGGEAEKDDSEEETEMLNIGDPKRLAVHRAKLAFIRRRQE